MYCIVVAAGSGSRMNQELPKQFLPVQGKPVLYYTLKHFFDFDETLRVILVSKHMYQEEINAVLALFPNYSIQCCEGGETRFLSVRNGLALVPPNELVFIHDAARPFVDKNVLQRCKNMAIEKGNAIPAIPIKDTIRQLQGDTNQVIDRSTLRAIQTPQTFQSSIIKEAFQQARRDDYTDEANVLEEQQIPVHLVEGSERTFKITVPMDLKLMELMLSEKINPA